MRVLLVYPRSPDTFWSLRQTLKVISKKAAFPPLGLLTVSAMLPKDWEQKLVDMNVNPLRDKDIKWADYVLISAMVVQKESVKEVLARCRKLHVKTVAGGSLFSADPEQYDADHLVVGEAEITLPTFLEDLKNGVAKHIYTSEERPEVKVTPIPNWRLLDKKKYASMSVQYSRGCPFDCEFCDVVVLNGHKVRNKSKEQFLTELDALYASGWRGGVFVVDDNFIGNKKMLKEEVLPAVIEWQRQRKSPFAFNTQLSINLADDEELMQLMANAGFGCVFIGIETPNEDSLAECNKKQNRGRDLLASVEKIQAHGFQVQAGFILGFDNDPENVFKTQIKFVQESGIAVAMIGLLNAPHGTKLYHRLQKENRLLETNPGDNTDCSVNFVTKMDRKKLVSGYKEVMSTLYAPKHYYTRARTFLKHYRPQGDKRKSKIELWHLWVLLRSMWYLGVKDRGRWQYWKFLLFTGTRRPRYFPMSVTLAIWGFHFQKLARRYAMVPADQASV